MKKWIAGLLAVAMTLSFGWMDSAANIDVAREDQKLHSATSLNSVRLTLVDKTCTESTENRMPWGSSLTFKAEVGWDDGYIASDDFAAVDWTVTDHEGNATQVWTKTWFDEWDGIARIKIFAPYGIRYSLKLSAISIKDPSLSDVRNIQVVDGGIYSTTFGEAYDRVIKNKYYIKGSFRWNIYVGEATTYYNQYPAGSQVEMNVDQHERCSIEPVWDMTSPPSIPPPGDYKSYKYYKSIGSVWVTGMKEGVKLVWNRVDSASGYIVYRFDRKTKKYQKIGSNKGSNKTQWRIRNTFTDRKVTAGTGYLYRVSSYKYVKGKVKISKKSGAASIIYRSNKYGNATQVKLTRTKAIKGKAGATVRLKANVSFESGKKPYSKTVRWYTNNKKIATVSKSGVVKLRAKGKCALYAKAHNGVKSKKLVIQVV